MWQEEQGSCSPIAYLPLLWKWPCWLVLKGQLTPREALCGEDVPGAVGCESGCENQPVALGGLALPRAVPFAAPSQRELLWWGWSS